MHPNSRLSFLLRWGDSDQTEEAPIIAPLDRISDLDKDRVVAIARTLSQASPFNEVVRKHITVPPQGELPT